MPAGRRHPFHRERLRYDAAFAAELGYCYDKGLPHSFYLGGPLEWTDTDRDKNQAYGLEKGLRCSMCGTAPWEWEQDKNAYEAVIETCMGCYVKDAKREDADGPGVSITLIPRLRAAMMRAQPRRAPRRVRGD